MSLHSLNCIILNSAVNPVCEAAHRCRVLCNQYPPAAGRPESTVHCKLPEETTACREGKLLYRRKLPGNAQTGCATHEMIRLDALWLSMHPLNMRAGTDSILARVVLVFGEARPRHACLFTSRRVNRMKVLIHDGHGIWPVNRRLNQGRFCWRPAEATVGLTRGQFDALVLGLPMRLPANLYHLAADELRQLAVLC